VVSLVPSGVSTAALLIGMVLSAGGWIVTIRQYGQRITALELLLSGPAGKPEEGLCAKQQHLQDALGNHCDAHEELCEKLGLTIENALTKFELRLKSEPKGQ
jgi:hypothetical protein